MYNSVIPVHNIRPGSAEVDQEELESTMKGFSRIVPSSKRVATELFRALRTIFFTVVFVVVGFAVILWLIFPKPRTTVENKNLCASFSVGMNQKQVQDVLDRHGPPYVVEAGHGQITVRDDVVGCILAIDGNGIVGSVATEKGSSRLLKR